MDQYSVYRDIEARTGGEIYLGVVGPVRTGKSTFIKRFMELFVLPAMENEHMKNQTRDELPQSAAGKTIMTTEPKFIPKEAAEIPLDEETKVKIRLIDCVGFMVEGAAGHIENDKERLVKTPWYEEQIPFHQGGGDRYQKGDHGSFHHWSGSDYRRFDRGFETGGIHTGRREDCPGIEETGKTICDPVEFCEALFR